MSDTAVIGAGIFGSTIARALTVVGRKVKIIDNYQPLAGSKPSGCLMKPSWFSSLGKGIFEPALGLLDDIYRVQDLLFKVPGIAVKAKVHWVPRKKVLARDDVTIIPGTVTKIEPLEQGGGLLTWHRLPLGTGTLQEEFDLIIVAAGYWTDKLLPIKMEGRKGVAYIGTGTVENVINPWAPYKQIVSFMEGTNQFWVGDGTAIKPENWTPEREEQSLLRAQKILNGQMAKPVLGIRPYTKESKPCFTKQQHPGIWISTGGAKNGMIAAGWSAYEIVRKTS